MTISIVLPENNGDPAVCLGTKVFTKSGAEIENVTKIVIDITPDDFIIATIDVCVNPNTKLENIHAMLGTETLEQIVAMHGYRLERVSQLGNGGDVNWIKDESNGQLPSDDPIVDYDITSGFATTESGKRIRAIDCYDYEQAGGGIKKA